jgi:hypothetical protein
MTGPLTFILSLVGSAILSRPKLPELEPDPTLREIAELKEKLRICEAARDAARADRDQSDAQLLTLRPAYDSLLHMFAQEQAMRLQLERDLIEADARVSVLRSNAKRSQEPRHLPLPPAPLSEGQAQEVTGQMLAQLAQISQMRAPPLMPANLHQALRQMDGLICNCAPGRHELFVRPSLGPLGFDD